ncbi:hypothetical protein ABLE91_18485 [Aquabacter sp. CN5-332]|uniref:hypothetical protein n=1 Tax=Aquabacter sp. CN5-332 TaxID=3156608 RepID=UPI0032B35A75
MKVRLGGNGSRGEEEGPAVLRSRPEHGGNPPRRPACEPIDTKTFMSIIFSITSITMMLLGTTLLILSSVSEYTFSYGILSLLSGSILAAIEFDDLSSRF